MTSSEEPTLYMYSTTVSDVGTVRSNNQDSSFAGAHLVAICDGMGGHAGGDTASTIAIRSLAHIEQDSAMAAHDAIVGKAKRERKLAGMGTTITAITLVADYWVLAHIGDSRAYLLRDGHLMRLTSDHSYVQHLIDTKRISQSEARNHPQRNVVMRVLGDFDIDARPDISIRTARAGDRLLLCSDGLCGVLEDSTIEETMLHFTDPEECAQKLVSMALRAGSTDNVSAVIADATLALNADGFDLPHQTPIVGGAASATLEAVADIIHEPVVSAPPLISTSSPAERAAALIASRKPRTEGEDEQSHQTVGQPSDVREETGERTTPDTGEIPVVQKQDGNYSADPNDPEVARAIHQEQLDQKKQARTKRFHGRVAAVITAVVVLVALCGGAWGAYAWSQNQYYLAADEGKVAIYQGVPTNIFGLQLSHPIEQTSMHISELPEQWRNQLKQGIPADSYSEDQFNQMQQEQEAKKKAAEEERKRLEEQAKKSKSSPSPSPSKKASQEDS